jgi:hypothetical protein
MYYRNGPPNYRVQPTVEAISGIGDMSEHSRRAQFLEKTDEGETACVDWPAFSEKRVERIDRDACGRIGADHPSQIAQRLLAGRRVRESRGELGTITHELESAIAKRGINVDAEIRGERFQIRASISGDQRGWLAFAKSSVDEVQARGCLTGAEAARDEMDPPGRHAAKTFIQRSNTTLDHACSSSLITVIDQSAGSRDSSGSGDGTRID